MRTIVLVLRSGGTFSFQDVELLARHINGKWQSAVRPRIICLWDKASQHYNLGNIELIPLTSNQPGTWSRIQLYSPEMEQYRPFLYIDLDTVVVDSLEYFFDLVKNPSDFIALEDFWQKGQLATPLVWMPAKSEKVLKVWSSFKTSKGSRMDRYLREVIKVDHFWQEFTNGSIVDFKPKNHLKLTKLPEHAKIVCFHGRPRIFDAQDIPWVKDYINQPFSSRNLMAGRVTVIIPYNKDRGWLKDAINSVPKEAQLILSKGNGNWPENFNKVLSQANREFVRWLHEDDMLTENCLEDSVMAMEEQGIDFIHGNAIEIYENGKTIRNYVPRITHPTLRDLLNKNTFHSATMMYRREVFEKVGKLDETLNTAEEYEFNLRCLKAGLKIGYCDSSLAYYRRHPQQKVRTVPAVEKTREREMVKTQYK